MDESVELTLRDLIEFLRRGIGWALVAALVAGVVAFSLSRRIEPTYLSRATLIATHQDPTGRAFGTVLLTAPALDAAAYRTAILSRAVLEPAAELLREEGVVTSAAQLRGAVGVGTEGTAGTTVIRIEARAQEAARAATIANAVARAAVRWDEARATRSLETIIAALHAQIEGINVELIMPIDENTREGLLRSRGDLTLQLSSARALRNAAVGRLEALESALAPFGPIAPRPMRTAIAAALLAAIAVYAVRLVRQVLDVRVHDAEELAALTGLPVLTEFARVGNGERRLPREAASYLRTNLLFDLSEVNPKVILVTSATAEQGKSSVAITLAESFATQGFRTLLMDADLRRPVSGTMYDFNPSKVMSFREAMMSQSEEIPTSVRLPGGTVLHLLPSFFPVPNPTELLGSRFRPLLDRVSERFDVIVLDSAPMLPVADTLILAPHASAVLLVVSMLDSNRRHIKQALELLGRVSVPKIGLVATNVSDRNRSYRTGYGYGYGSEGWDEAVADPRIARPTRRDAQLLQRDRLP